MGRRYDVYGIGNAIADTEVRVEDALLSVHGLRPGLMTLVSEEAQQRLLGSLGGRPMVYAAGGSAANTMAGVVHFGGSACFLGKVGADAPGALYRESLAEVGVEFDGGTAPAPTGACLILVTPDGERTMQTHLGASSLLDPADVDEEQIARSSMLYVEGYLWGAPSNARAAEQAIAAAKRAGVPVALSLSDPAVTSAFLDTFRSVVRESADVVFSNEHEAAIYAGAATLDPPEASEERRRASLSTVGTDAERVFMTCGADGSMVWELGETLAVGGHRVEVVDTTGAGDLYAAGVVYGLTRGMSAREAAMLGTFASARVVTRMGPRLPGPLADEVPTILAGAHPDGAPAA